MPIDFGAGLRFPEQVMGLAWPTVYCSEVKVLLRTPITETDKYLLLSRTHKLIAEEIKHKGYLTSFEESAFIEILKTINNTPTTLLPPFQRKRRR